VSEENSKESKVRYWVELSEYDMLTAEAMLGSKRYRTPIVFLC